MASKLFRETGLRYRWAYGPDRATAGAETLAAAAHTTAAGIYATIPIPKHFRNYEHYERAVFGAVMEQAEAIAAHARAAEAMRPHFHRRYRPDMPFRIAVG